MNKSELRKLYIDKRRKIAPSDYEVLSDQVAARLFREIDFRPLGAVHCFISLTHAGEVGTDRIFAHIRDRFPNIRTFAPRLNEATQEIEALPYGADTELTPGRFKVKEPADGESADPGEMDIVIVPLLCFDLRGFRVGYGKGYYDKFLVKCRPDCLKVGVSFFQPIERIDDVHDGDIALDLFILPADTYRPIKPASP